MSRHLTKEEARLRAEATKKLGKVMALTDKAFRHVLYNRKGRALQSIRVADEALSDAGMAIVEWQRGSRRRSA